MPPRLSQEVRTWLHLHRVMAAISQRLTAQLANYNLTSAQFDVLAQLYRTPGLVQQALADRLLVSKGNIVGLLNRMEQAGLVTRQPHPEDGRAHLVSLTPHGTTLATQVVPEHEALIVECLAVLSPEDGNSLHDLLRRFNHALRPA
ncbi:MarR family winged helix-turn-helix transcriptional regulator [Herpetosiphon giganteus]|uniref:MarR family winged helix-turn-helix transcriptional regulator n=1 Tax=Herpetosiphon giganteus TaxID=2029754 RepID=UPI00195D3CB5|nr:MarR family transcriptional regulator [Herpetosiphon giganteus]MBM7844856.1 DNA-binding MarR family transcriptional regulator [Herpetosiphon giganteus]